jgi:predicted RNA binding protein YcfA (HicA-like mRNA interferase family)
MTAMREVTYKECQLILNYNGFHYDHQSGSHVIYKNDRGKHISIKVNSVNACVWRRLVKENNLDERFNKKRKKTW